MTDEELKNQSQDASPQPTSEEAGNPRASLKSRLQAILQTIRQKIRRAPSVEKTDVPVDEQTATTLASPPSASASRFRQLLEKATPRDLIKNIPTSFEPAALAEWLSHLYQRRKPGIYGKLVTIFLCAFFLADLTALLLEKYIPEPPPARFSQYGSNLRKSMTLEDYNSIFSRNLFNSKGLIPGEETIPGEGQDLGGVPVKTSLPFNLIGTVILLDELKSIATIEDKSASRVYPVRIQDEIPGKARILAIEPFKVIFVNVSSGRREFVEIPQDLQVSNPRITLGKAPGRGGPSGPGVERVSPNQFNVSRTEVDKALSDLNQVLTQARAVPNFENGLPAGYKLFQIVPGSIYDKLGLQNGDTLCGLNGQALNDPAKAFELLGELKTSSHLELCVKREGRQSNFAYDIR